MSVIFLIPSSVLYFFSLPSSVRSSCFPEHSLVWSIVESEIPTIRWWVISKTFSSS
jgi:hypothetical protein